MKGHRGGSRYSASRSIYDPQVLDCPSRSCSTALPFALIFLCSSLLCWNTSSLYQNSSFPFWSGLFVRRMKTIKLARRVPLFRVGKSYSSLTQSQCESPPSPPLFISFIPPLFLSLFTFSKVYWLYFLKRVSQLEHSYRFPHIFFLIIEF